MLTTEDCQRMLDSATEEILYSLHRKWQTRAKAIKHGSLPRRLRQGWWDTPGLLGPSWSLRNSGQMVVISGHL